MSAFYLIADKILDKTIFLNNILTIENFNETKFQLFHKIIVNKFISENSKKSFINNFCNVQKIYRKFSRVAYLLKFNKAKLIITQDLNYNELDVTYPSVLCIFHYNYKYLFCLNDLIQLIDSALTNAIGFICDPNHIKNPYNNMVFEKSILYSIYIFINNNRINYCELFFNFCKYEFNLKKFKNICENIINEKIILRYVKNSPQSVLIKDITSMINYFNKYIDDKEIEINIHKNFPKDKLIKILSPYLLLYLKSINAYPSSLQSLYKTQFLTKMNNFYNYNPQFGRINIHLFFNTQNFKRRCCKIIRYNDTHILFRPFNKTIYLNNHLKPKPIVYIDIRSIINVRNNNTINTLTEYDTSNNYDDDNNTLTNDDTSSNYDDDTSSDYDILRQ